MAPDFKPFGVCFCLEVRHYPHNGLSGQSCSVIFWFDEFDVYSLLRIYHSQLVFFTDSLLAFRIEASKLWLLEITLMSLVSYPVALLLLCKGQIVAYMNKVMNWSDLATMSKAMAMWVCECTHIITENLRQTSLPNRVFSVLMSWICFLNLQCFTNFSIFKGIIFPPCCVHFC